MVRHATWIASFGIGCLPLVLPAAPALAQQVSAEEEPTPAAVSQLDDSDDGQASPADYVVETPAESDEGAQMPADSAADEAADSAADDATEVADQSVDPAPLEARDSGESAAHEQPKTEFIKERFANGAVKIEREVTQDTQGNYVNHGVWKMYDQQGNLVAQGEYAHGQRIGTWVRWYRSVTENDLLSKIPYRQFVGPFISQATFKNDQLDGEWTIFDGKKRHISQWQFTDGQRNGASTWWYPNGRKMREIQFRNGDMDGPAIEWSSEAQLTLKDTYQAGRKLAAKTSHHQGGAKKSQGMYLMAKEVEQTPDDWWTCKLRSTTKTGNDEKHGPWISWHANGQKQLEGTYEHDVQVGPFTWWHANGQKALEGHFEQGKQDGAWTWWYPTGQKSIQGEYAHGNPTGRWTWWKEDGKVAQSADLSQSEGVVIDVPRVTDPQPTARLNKPLPRQPIKR